MCVWDLCEEAFSYLYMDFGISMRRIAIAYLSMILQWSSCDEAFSYLYMDFGISMCHIAIIYLFMIFP